MLYADIGGSAIATPVVFIAAVTGMGKLGGALLGTPVPPCYWVVVMGIIEGCDVAAWGSDVGKRGAASPAIIIAVGTFIVAAA